MSILFILSKNQLLALLTFAEETRIERDTCTPVFMAALFIIARTWKQPRCPSADECIRKLWYIYTMVWGGRRQEGSGWGTRVYLWWIHFDIWQNQYNIVKFKNKIKFLKKEEKKIIFHFVASIPLKLQIRWSYGVQNFLEDSFCNKGNGICISEMSLIFLLTILILTCASSTPALHIMYSTYKLKEQGNDIQP